MKRIISVICIALLILSLTACGKKTDDGNRATDTDGTTAPISEVETISTVENTEQLNILVAYFGRDGAVKAAADEIAEKTGGALFEIKTEKQYTGKQDYLDEITAGEHPVITDRVDDMAAYNAVFIGFESVDGQLPMAVVSFMEEYDLRDMVLIPFCLNGGEGLAGITDKIDSVCFGASQTVMLSFNGETTDKEIGAWLTGLGF